MAANASLAALDAAIRVCAAAEIGSRGWALALTDVITAALLVQETMNVPAMIAAAHRVAVPD